MRAYLPISHDELTDFLQSGTKKVESIFAATPFFTGENEELDEEEIEYLLSFEAATQSLDLRSSKNAPGIVIAIELSAGQVNIVGEKSVSLNSDLLWDQVQCALLLFPVEEELIWFATQEIELNLAEWK